MPNFFMTDTRNGAWLLHTETHRLYRITDDVREHLKPDSFGQLTQADLDPVSNDLEILKRSGQLIDANRRRLNAANPLDGANLALNVNLTAHCNLGCTYCFAEGGDYGRIKGKLDPTQDVDDIMAFVSENTGVDDAVRFEFFGGEPMMNFETIEALCLRSVKIAETDGIRFHYRISTNLTTRLTERELSLFERFHFVVSVSIDGGAATHDRNRPNLSGRGSHQKIIENCRIVRARSDEITLVARMTYVPSPHSSLMEDVRELHTENIFDWFQVLPATVSDELVADVFGDEFDGMSSETVRQLNAEKVDSEFSLLADHYTSLFSPENRFRGFLEIEAIVRMILKGEVANGHCSGGRNYFTFSPDKSIMPCHRLVGEAEFQASNFGVPVEAASVESWRRDINDTPICRKCAIRYICGGGCKQENFVGTGDINLPDLAKCSFQFRLAATAVQSIAEANDGFRRRERDNLSDLFVSCGRPTLSVERPPFAKTIPELRQLTPLF